MTLRLVALNFFEQEVKKYIFFCFAFKFAGYSHIDSTDSIMCTT